MICQKLWIFIWFVFLHLQVWWWIHRQSNERHLFRPLPLVLYFRLLEQLLRQGPFDTFRRYNPGGLTLVERPWNWQWISRFKTWWKWLFFQLWLWPCRVTSQLYHLLVGCHQSGLVTISILFCWVFEIKDRCKKVRFQQTHSKGLDQLLLTLSWDLRAQRGHT